MSSTPPHTPRSTKRFRRDDNDATESGIHTPRPTKGLQRSDNESNAQSVKATSNQLDYLSQSTYESLHGGTENTEVDDYEAIPVSVGKTQTTKEGTTPLHRSGSVRSASLSKSKRDVPEKSEFFMSLAVLASQRSKDPSMQVGACLVDENQKYVLGIGYNGAPNNVDDKDYPWYHVEYEKDAEESAAGSTYSAEEPPIKHKIKNDYVIHAEANALSLSDRTKHNKSIMYCTHYPCKECAKTMLHHGVSKIFYQDDSKKDDEAYLPTKVLLQYCEEKNLMTHEKLSNVISVQVTKTVRPPVVPAKLDYNS